MAVKKDTDALLDLGKAFGGGIAAEIVADIAAKNLGDFIAENPKLGEAIPAIAAGGAYYFMNEKQRKTFGPVLFGMVGAVGAGMSDDFMSMAGFGRTKGSMNGAEADEYQKGIAYIEQLQKDSFGGAQNKSQVYNMQGINLAG